MKFNSRDAAKLLPRGKPQVGDVFPAKSTGPKWYRKGTRYFVIIAITPGMHPGSGVAHMLGLDEEGNINSTTSYGEHVMEERPRVGRCPDIANLSLNIEWETHHG